MFRFDFEVVCLKKALSIAPQDGWALIQYGDHLKRQREYKQALEILSQAALAGENEVGKSSEADVYSQQGYYQKSILTYQSIPDWKNKPEVLTAIADNQRKMGKLDEANTSYLALIERSQKGLLGFSIDDSRALAGMAEVAKSKGQLETAARIYHSIIDGPKMSDGASYAYKLALCRVLKILGEFDEAYTLVDEVIQVYPFALEAKFLRGSILGLIGKELDGLEDLPESDISQSWRGWLP
ncbi:MAG: hypothetical protein PF450_05375, partial [Bacteroidales bacterium]|nr:hypothetical protein [Bacteroidales bacterium]